MPRRQFKVADAAADLSHQLRRVDDLPPTIDVASMFGGEVADDTPLEIEIGSGKGLFLATEAPARPDTAFLGIEIVDKYARLAAMRIAKTGARNAVMISGNAGPILKDRVPTDSVDAIHVYFPDPWWKPKHRRRRVVSRESVPQFRRVLRGGGRLHFWTDVLDYFEDTIEMIAEIAPEFGVPYPETVRPAEHDLDYRTHFERRSRQNDIPVYRVRWELRSDARQNDVGQND